MKDAAEFVGEGFDSQSGQEAKEELGKAALTVAKTVNVCLLPLVAVNTMAEKAKTFFKEDFPELMQRQLAAVPEDRLITPKASVAGPAMQGLAYSHEEPDLRDLYIALLASAMDSENAPEAHPAFAEIIGQLTAEEAGFLGWLLRHNLIPLVEVRYHGAEVSGGGYTLPVRHLTPTVTPGGDQPAAGSREAIWDLDSTGPARALENFQRLGLLELDYSRSLGREDAYEMG